MKAVLAALACSCLLAASGCQTANSAEAAAYGARIGGDSRRGAAVIAQAGCGSCHLIPGVPAAHGLVGPPLLGWSRRTFIAGEVPNTPENLVRWIRVPQSIEPHTAMPALGLSDQDARDAAAFLYTLR